MHGLSADKYSSAFGSGQQYSYIHEEDESSFQLVDTSRAQRPVYQRSRFKYNLVRWFCFELTAADIHIKASAINIHTKTASGCMYSFTAISVDYLVGKTLMIGNCLRLLNPNISKFNHR